jgi:AAA domain, putative AbiEii toxin, Type IV TA system
VRHPMLEYLRLENVGPAAAMEMALAPRLNLLTGDNGLGKSFLLDVAWWALTRKWPRDVNDRLTSGYRAMPRDVKKSASIDFRVKSKSKSVGYRSEFSRQDQTWTGKQGRPHNPGLVIYGHADGGFSVWDPARNYWKTRKGSDDALASVPAFVFAPQDIWDGLWLEVDGARTNVCRGLIDDWSIWIREGGEPAKAMSRVLSSLAAPGETIEVGPLRPLSPNDARDYPTIRMSYAPEPIRIVHTSAGLRRIAALAYMLMWSWDRHVVHADSQGLDRTTSVILLLDEIEGHLHPRWQRSILRSVLDVAKVLHDDANVQLLAATHSPLVLASAEPFFDPALDAWFDLDLDRIDGRVELRQRPFVPHGDVSNWLASNAFDLKEARSLEAETAIEKARKLLREKNPTLLEAKAIQHEVHAAGVSSLDPFWVRWSAFVDGLENKS